MSFDVLLPQMGFSMTEGSISEWLVADGAAVTEGQPLYVLEADKAAEELPAPASGTLRVCGEVGVIYPVGTVIARIE